MRTSSRLHNQLSTLQEKVVFTPDPLLSFLPYFLLFLSSSPSQTSEGIIMCCVCSLYEHGRSLSLLKYKVCHFFILFFALPLFYSLSVLYFILCPFFVFFLPSPPSFFL